MDEYINTLWLDFETRSHCDLPNHGVYNYAQHPTTEVLCISYAFDDELVQTWTPELPFPARIREHAGRIAAHNAAFERLIWWYVLCADYNIPEPRLEQFYCTATQARANCMPGSLEDVGRFLGTGMRKDYRGAQLIRQMCVPPYIESPALTAEMIAYCEQDVRTMREVSKAMRPLSEYELADYHVNERINDRGILIDVPLAQAAISYAAQELEDIQKLVVEITHGEVTSVRSPKMRDWVAERLGPEAKKLMIVHKDGVAKESIDKAVRANLLVFAEENPDEVPPEVADVIQCADDLWASSVAKFQRMAERADEEDHRVRGAFVFNGGAATGRAASFGIQLHNLGRTCAEDPSAVRAAMVTGKALVPTHGPRVTDVLKGMLRPALIPAPGHVFVVADWSSIEARVNPWLSNCTEGQAKLDLFRAGIDVYKINAMATFGGTLAFVSSTQRQIGKVQELACFGPQTQVLTNNGIKDIVAVSGKDLLWDGEKWVAHKGVLYKGMKEVICLIDTEITPDHLVLTKKTWLPAQQLVLNEKFLSQALEIGLKNLPSSSTYMEPQAAWGIVSHSARVGLNLIKCQFITYVKALLRVVVYAREKDPVHTEKCSLNTRSHVLMTSIDVDYLIAWPLAKTDAITQKTRDIVTTDPAEFKCTPRGAQIKLTFLNMLCRCLGGIIHLWNWIESTSIKTMRQITYGLLHAKKTVITAEKWKTYKSTSSNLKPVYDILNSGNLNRFTIITGQGPLIVHNCGFSGGHNAFAAMGRAYNIVLPEADAKRMVRAWRAANPWAMQYWAALERAYMSAMRHPGTEFTAGRITYLFDKVHLWYILPSGRVLCYPFARLDEEGVTYAKAAWKPKADAKEWPRARLWVGVACENGVQAVANDVLRDRLFHLDGYPRDIQYVIAHIHDEIVLEVPEAHKYEWQDSLTTVMRFAPSWAKDLPLDAEVSIMHRYGK